MSALRRAFEYDPQLRERIQRIVEQAAVLRVNATSRT